MTSVCLNRLVLGAIALCCIGCASNPEITERRQAREQAVAAILGEPIDASARSAEKRCLSDHEFRSFRVLDDQHLLFHGRRDRIWLNRLRMRCPDLRRAQTLQVRTHSITGRICDMDSFKAADWFPWPWYRRWPWHWASSWGTTMNCTLGTFRPVTPDQAERLEALLKP